MDPASKVKVEYTDASNVYSTFASELIPKLPLKELHWSSSSRPTRSIGSLHLDLISGDYAESASAPSSTGGPTGTQDNEGLSKDEGPRRERRHQIPGLRRTPYLKIFLLSCNDVETYKGTYRKHLREWVKENTPTSQSSAALSKQNNHDAFEWLIIHVLPPSVDDSSSTSKRLSNQGDGTTEKRPSSSRWPSRNAISVIEKLRLEFNGTSKNAIDRVVQVQLVGPPPDGLPSVDRRGQDSKDGKDGWDDLIFKFKALILSSFDLRVSQYEEDIREREGQRKVFGWNFNTFFVLKEGLAMGFENMGLLEDALTVYRELSFGLKSAMKEQCSGEAEQQTAHFVDYTDDLYKNYEQALRVQQHLDAEDLVSWKQLVDPGASLLDTNRKPFRDLILSNKISVFDFECYVFARQTTLLLRLAKVDYKQAMLDSRATSHNGTNIENSNLSNPTKSSKPTDWEPENLLLLAEAARLSIEFVTYMAPIVREDIQYAIAASETNQSENQELLHKVHDGAIENFVMSWLFSASQSVLGATLARSLTAQLNSLTRRLAPNNIVLGPSGTGDQDAKQKDAALPTRTSSLPSNNPARSFSPPNEPISSVDPLNVTRLLPTGSPHPGAQDLAAGRGDIEALRRRIVGKIGVQHGWWQGEVTGIPSNYSGQDGEMHGVDLDDEFQHEEHVTASGPRYGSEPSHAGLCNVDLLTAVVSNGGFYKAYENLTVSALAHYVIGSRSKAAEAMTADLAVARFHLEDYSVAASYFRQLAPSYAKASWTDLEISMLDTYAQCLSHLKNNVEYVRICLKILAKIIKDSGVTVNQLPKPSLSTYRNYLSTILITSKSFDEELSVPLSDYFSNVQLCRYIEHFTEQDGFHLDLNMRSLLPEKILVQSVLVRLVNTEADQRSELWLSTKEAHSVEPGAARILLQSNILQPGWFSLDKVHITSSNIRFSLDLSPASQVLLFPRSRNSTTSDKFDGLNERNRVLVWPKTGSFNVRVTHYETINLEQSNSIKIELDPGQNDSIKCRLFLKAASAGLRLHTAKAILLEEDTKIIDQSQPGNIVISALPVDTKTNILVPYSVETDLQGISVRAIAEYTTPNGDFSYACNTNLPIQLPLAIGVQDLFKQTMLVSKFTIGTSSAVPVRILNCHLESSPDYYAISPDWTNDALDVFVRQPLSLVSKIFKKSREINGGRPAPTKLFLRVKYRCWNEIILATVENDLLAALDATPYRRFARVLGPALLAALQVRMANQDFEALCLLHEIEMGTFDEWTWGPLIAGLLSKESLGLEEWLRRWHEENPKISLGNTNVLSPVHDLIVPVEVAQMQVVHTAGLKRLRTSPRSAQLDSAPLGEGIVMELAISHTRKWEDIGPYGTEKQALDFCYELQANPDLWVTGGQKKAHFSAVENETKRFAVLLWPQKTGHLVLPSLEIHSLRASQERHDGAQLVEPAISCELDYQNLGETILIVPDLMSTTVNLDPSGNGRGWLFESKSRTS